MKFTWIFGFHDFRHAAFCNQVFYVPVSLLSLRRRVVISAQRSIIQLLVSAFITLHRRVLRRIWQKSGLNPTREMHARAGTIEWPHPTSRLRLGHPQRGHTSWPTPLVIGSRGERSKGEGRVIRHLPFHYCFTRDTAAWHAIARSIPPLYLHPSEPWTLNVCEIATHYAQQITNALLQRPWTDRGM